MLSRAILPTVRIIVLFSNNDSTLTNQSVIWIILHSNYSRFQLTFTKMFQTSQIHWKVQKFIMKFTSRFVNKASDQWRNWRKFGCPMPGGSLAKITIKFLLVHWANWPEPHFLECQKICNRWPPKAGIGETVKFGPPFLVDMDREKLLWLFYLS